MNNEFESVMKSASCLLQGTQKEYENGRMVVTRIGRLRILTSSIKLSPSELRYFEFDEEDQTTILQNIKIRLTKFDENYQDFRYFCDGLVTTKPNDKRVFYGGYQVTTSYGGAFVNPATLTDYNYFRILPTPIIWIV